jgi:hypothetical protein
MYIFHEGLGVDIYIYRERERDKNVIEEGNLKRWNPQSTIF